MAKKVLIITAISFAVFFYIDDLFFQKIRQQLNELISQVGISHILAYTLVGIPIFTGVLVLHKRSFAESLGLNKSLPTALIFSLVCVIPMVFGYSVFYNFNSGVTLNDILIVSVAAGFFEELYFRGFLFGQLYRFTRFGFILSAFLGALLFAALHLYRDFGVFEFLLVFLITFVSGLIYGWVYVEWNFNLWVPIFLHLLINLSWELFAIGDDSSYANLFRFLTVVLFIVLTVVFKRRKGFPVEVTWRKLFFKKLNHFQQKI